MPRLIDADALKAHFAWWKNDDMKEIFNVIIDLQPTIVPEEKKEEDNPVSRLAEAGGGRGMTNADKIRQMTDEELAVYLGTELDGCVGRKCVIDDNTDCQECWLDWLKEEVGKE